MKLGISLFGVLAMCTAQAAWADVPASAALRDGFIAGKLDWSAVEARAKEEGKVNLYYWGGDDTLNVWMDSVVAPAMAAQGIKLNPVRVTATKDAVDLVLAEKNSGKGVGEGSVDLIWVNGDNFATLKQQGALYGGFAQRLPNAKNLEWDPSDQRALLNLRDFGVETNGTEMPWSGEEYNCSVNSKRVADADIPHDFDALKAYLEKHPGKFTYVKPPHYIGNTFVEEAIYAHNPDGTGAAPFQQSLSEIKPEELARLIAPGLEYLKSLEPLLLNGASGSPNYPEDNKAIDGLFLNGEIDFNCKFGLYGVAKGLSTGTYPEGAKQFVFPKNTMIKNKNYLVIPSNAPDGAAAMVLANWMSSVESQASKLKEVGMPSGIDSWKLNKTDADLIASSSPGLVGVTQDEMDANAAPDTNATLVNVIKATWLEYIERHNPAPIAQIVAEAYKTAK
ncbi:ABC transporter substrate-binding protein [bacterium]|nr:ABC transporter substrate-binding protein [bacterium]